MEQLTLLELIFSLYVLTVVSALMISISMQMKLLPAVIKSLVWFLYVPYVIFFKKGG